MSGQPYWSLAASHPLQFTRPWYLLLCTKINIRSTQEAHQWLNFLAATCHSPKYARKQRWRPSFISARLSFIWEDCLLSKQSTARMTRDNIGLSFLSVVFVSRFWWQAQIAVPTPVQQFYGCSQGRMTSDNKHVNSIITGKVMDSRYIIKNMHATQGIFCATCGAWTARTLLPVYALITARLVTGD